VLFLAGCGGSSVEHEFPNVLLVSIDTLRADRLGCYGYERPTTPALDRFAREHAVRFAHAFAESSWTLPSHATMLTGLHPLSHGARQPDLPLDSRWRIPLASLLYETHYSFGVTDGGWLTDRWGFSLGFESFRARDRDIDEALSIVLDFVRYRSDKGAWFGFLHTYDVHCPYDPPAPYAGTFRSDDAEPIEVAGRCGNPHFNSLTLSPGQARYLSDRYDEDVRRVDDALAGLFAELDRLDLWKNTVVIVTSDHGEEFLEHGQIGHERTLSREALSIPLLIAVPGVAPRVVEEPVGLADLVPTIIELVGDEWLPEREYDFDGRSLLGLMRGESDPREPVLSELDWQLQLVAESDAATTHTFTLGPGMPPESDSAVKRRARLLEAGYKPGPMKIPGTRADELSGLGYGGER
jgi:membrane-anchored protein YejM (alkaline phosphatase superfamily)